MALFGEKMGFSVGKWHFLVKNGILSAKKKKRHFLVKKMAFSVKKWHFLVEKMAFSVKKRALFGEKMYFQ